MAQKTTVILLDDLSGEEAEDVSTVEFGLDGVTYEIDLHEAHAEDLRDALAPFVAAARKTGTRRGGGRKPSPGGREPARVDREQARAIRDWARSRGYSVADRGRIPAAITDAYQQQAGAA